MAGQPTRRLNPLLVAALVAGLALAVYWRTASPTITFRHDGPDSGDLVTAAINLGIPHPTGYPLYTMLAHLVTLLPGEPAGNVSRFSGLCAALAVGVLVLASYAATTNRAKDGNAVVHLVAAATAGGMLAFGSLLWSQATIPEVYAQSALLVALWLWLVVAAGRPARPYLLALVFGLVLAHHVAAALLLPSLWPYARAIRRWLTPRRAGALLLCLLPGLAMYVYLPLRASAQPVPNWGQASEWSGFVWLVTGKAYQSYLGGLLAQQWPRRLAAWLSIWVRELGVVGLALVLLGLWKAWDSDRRRTLHGLTYLALTSAYAIAYGTTDSYVYLVPVALFVALWLAEGAAALLVELREWLYARGRRTLSTVALLAVLVLPAGSLVARFATMDLSQDQEAYQAGMSLLQGAEPEAVLISRGDLQTFPLWYCRYGLGQRRDVTVVDRYLLALGWYRSQVAALSPELAGLPAQGDSTEATKLVVSALGASRPVQLTYEDQDLLNAYRWSFDGRLYTLRP